MAHYLRIWKHGSADLPGRPTLAEVLNQGIQSRDGCWIWGGPISSSGYGRIGSLYTHRVSYEIHVGAIPEGLQIDHLCFEKLCANPDHLEAVTQEENLRRQRLRMTRKADGTWVRTLSGVTR
ncbi:HNH endonuclease signature motif containing protein [Microbacterium sp. NPDC028030]|uniref:HNH endonuclease signature motif containing protein n=1 Tax=Microbacterium sp. NPDC028030 TaxID=3155124 RepID=UPI0033C9D602